MKKFFWMVVLGVGCGGAETSTPPPHEDGQGAAGGTTLGSGGAPAITILPPDTTVEPCITGPCFSSGSGGGNPLSCEEQACADVGATCGFAWHDCDSDGVYLAQLCGSCVLPEVCGGGFDPKTCSSTCESRYTTECAAVGLPSEWGWDATCKTAYRVVGGSVEFFEPVGECPLLAGVEPDGITVKCCP